MIELNNVLKKYGIKKVLDIPYFKFENNKSYLLIGSNGSGKSTLLKCILGINSLTKGNINLNSNNIGYIPEKIFSADFITINEYFNLICLLYNVSPNYELINYYCNLFKLQKNIKLNNLSKGMLQKVIIIQSLIHEANLFIFDEPLNGLDKESQNIFLSIVNKLNSENKTIIITTHYPQFYDTSFDFVITFESGELVNANN